MRRESKLVELARKKAYTPDVLELLNKKRDEKRARWRERKRRQRAKLGD